MPGGDVVTVPGGAVHAFVNVTAKPARQFIQIVPGLDAAAFFTGLGEVMRDGVPMRMRSMPSARNGTSNSSGRRCGPMRRERRGSNAAGRAGWVALASVAEPQQRHQHEGECREGRRYENERRQAAVENTRVQE